MSAHPRERESGLGPESIVTADQALVACEIQGEVVILSMRDGAYYGLDPVASRVWQLLQTPHSVRAICEQLLVEYDGVTREECTADVLAVLGRLVEWRLVSADAHDAA
jgi:hypothetical protein